MNTFGELQITVNSQTAGSLLTDLPTDIPLWVIVDVYGSTQSVQFVQEGKCSHSTLFWLLLQKVQKIRILKFLKFYSKLISTLPKHSRDPKNQPYFIINPIQIPAELTKVE